MILSRMPRLIPLFSIVCVMQATGAVAANLAAHKAYYTLEAKRLGPESGLAAISGRLAYEIKGSDCEGYAVNYRIANRITRGDGTDPQETDFRVTSFETGDGLTLDVQETQFANAEAKATARVKATRQKLDGEVSADQSGDETKSFKIDGKYMFPTVYQKKLIDLAQSGATRDDSYVYEATDGDKANHVIAFIGAKKTGYQVEGADEATRAEFAKLTYWPVNISYYAADAEGDAQPEYQTTFNLFENGFSADLVLDYGSYALSGKLSKLEVFKTDACK